MKPSIGRIVHFVQAKPAWAGQYAGEVHLPAIIVAVWSDTCVNLQVFTDGTNSDEQNMSPVKWLTSVNFDGSDTPQPRSWHWPETVQDPLPPAASAAASPVPAQAIQEADAAPKVVEISQSSGSGSTATIPAAAEVHTTEATSTNEKQAEGLAPSQSGYEVAGQQKQS